jgi:1-acyl-sn-glycerol-3-phosphate acyltransferase
MRFIIGRLYSIYAALIFTALFLLILPWQIIFSLKLSWHKYALWLNKPWAWFFFLFTGIYARTFGTVRIPQGQYIICSNHFSYLDIPALGLLGGSFKFFGKISLAKIPVFGWMYKKLHVTVDRASFKSRAHALALARQMVDRGFNMAFFPEGGVRASRYPEMARFQDGAFRLAVEFQIPIVPVVMPRNHLVWPYDRRQLFFGGRTDVHVLPPVYPQAKSEDEVIRMKDEVRGIMQEELDALAIPNSVNIALT